MIAPSSRTLGELLFEQAARYADAPAVFCGDRVASYAALKDHAARIASALAARGIKHGDRVGLLLNNRLEWVETFFGAAMLGAEIVAFSTWSTRDELDYLIADSGISALITLDNFSGQDFAAILRALVPEADRGKAVFFTLAFGIPLLNVRVAHERRRRAAKIGDDAAIGTDCRGWVKNADCIRDKLFSSV